MKSVYRRFDTEKLNLIESIIIVLLSQIKLLSVIPNEVRNLLVQHANRN